MLDFKVEVSMTTKEGNELLEYKLGDYINQKQEDKIPYIEMRKEILSKIKEMMLNSSKFNWLSVSMIMNNRKIYEIKHFSHFNLLEKIEIFVGWASSPARGNWISSLGLEDHNLNIRVEYMDDHTIIRVVKPA